MNPPLGTVESRGPNGDGKRLANAPRDDVDAKGLHDAEVDRHLQPARPRGQLERIVRRLRLAFQFEGIGVDDKHRASAGAELGGHHGVAGSRQRTHDDDL